MRRIALAAVLAVATAAAGAAAGTAAAPPGDAALLRRHLPVLVLHPAERFPPVAVDATAQSTVYYTPFNDAIQQQAPYGLMGARAEYGPAHRRWSVNAYARNLTDTEYVMATFATSPVAFGGRPGASRHAGIQLVLQR